MAAARQWRQRWILVAAMANGNCRWQHLTTTMDNGKAAMVEN
jgi:hypothetical protein